MIAPDATAIAEMMSRRRSSVRCSTSDIRPRSGRSSSDASLMPASSEMMAMVEDP